MATRAMVVLLLAPMGSFAAGQLTSLPAANLVNPQVLTFDVGAPPAGLVGPNDPYFAAFGLCDINIVNAPGAHAAVGDTLSSGFIGNCIASVNNTLAIVPPGCAMDDHSPGAGWSFRLLPGTTATQFGGLIVDQTGHNMSVETWMGGVLQDTFTFNMAGGFPNPHVYFEDLSGFDEVRFQNVVATGGWGIDDFTLGNVLGAPTGAPCPPLGGYQLNSASSSLTVSGLADPGPFLPIFKNASVNTPETMDLSSSNVGLPFDIALLVGGATTPGWMMTGGGQLINIDISDPGVSFFNGGVLPNLSTSAFPAPSLQIPFAVPIPILASGQLGVVNPANPDGISMSHAAEYVAETCATYQSFETTMVGAGNAPIAWSNPSAAGAPWTVHSGGTSSTGTGPTSAHSGSNYLYCETSAMFNTVFSVDTCLVDLTQISGVTGVMSFALSRIGATIGFLELFIDDGSGAGFVPITDMATGVPLRYLGSDPTNLQGGTEWTVETVPFLHNIAGTAITVRFRYTSSSSFTGDIAIDDVVFQ